MKGFDWTADTVFMGKSVEFMHKSELINFIRHLDYIATDRGHELAKLKEAVDEIPESVIKNLKEKLL